MVRNGSSIPITILRTVSSPSRPAVWVEDEGRSVLPNQRRPAPPRRVHPRPHRRQLKRERDLCPPRRRSSGPFLPSTKERSWHHLDGEGRSWRRVVRQLPALVHAGYGPGISAEPGCATLVAGICQADSGHPTVQCQMARGRISRARGFPCRATRLRRRRELYQGRRDGKKCDWNGPRRRAQRPPAGDLFCLRKARRSGEDTERRDRPRRPANDAH